jgi:hypothetical protein
MHRIVCASRMHLGVGMPVAAGVPARARLGGPTAENRAGDEDPPATLARSACGHGIAARERRPEK